MRILIDILIVTMLLGILAGFVLNNREEETDAKLRMQAKQEVDRFQKEINLQSAIIFASGSPHAHPVTVDPKWFEGRTPDNPLLDNDRPWVEVAGPDQKDREHPLDRVATSGDLAEFWYNPYKGIIRVRVPATLSDQGTLELYNEVNGSNLRVLFGDDKRNADKARANS